MTFFGINDVIWNEYMWQWANVKGIDKKRPAVLADL